MTTYQDLQNYAQQVVSQANYVKSKITNTLSTKDACVKLRQYYADNENNLGDLTVMSELTRLGFGDLQMLANFFNNPVSDFLVQLGDNLDLVSSSTQQWYDVNYKDLSINIVGGGDNVQVSMVELIEDLSVFSDYQIKQNEFPSVKYAGIIQFEIDSVFVFYPFNESNITAVAPFFQAVTQLSPA